MAGLPHGFPDGSEPPRFARFQNRKQDWGSKMKRSATVADQVVPKRGVEKLRELLSSATMADQAVLKPRWLQVIPIGSSATMADQAVLKHSGGNSYYTIGSATMADQVVLKLNTVGICVAVVQQPWQTRWFSNLLVWICRLNWAFLFQRTAKSARSSCFCDPPDRFSIRLLDLRKRLFPP